MSSVWITMNLGSGGANVDAEGVTYGSPPTTRYRSRVVVSGSIEAAVADVVNSAAAVAAYALPTRPIIERSGTATQTSVAGSASSVTLLAANSSVRKRIIYNDSSATLYLRFNASAATNANWSHVLPPIAGNTIFGLIEEGPGFYNGEIRGIWSSAAGNARITEQT